MNAPPNRVMRLPMPMDQYVSDPAPDYFPVAASINASTAKTLLSRSPLHAWTGHPRLNPAHEQDDPSKFDIGRVAHRMVIEGASDGVAVIDAPDWRTKAAKEAREAALAEGRMPVLAEAFAAVQKMVAAAREYIAASDELPRIMSGGAAEEVWMWEEAPGIVCRCRPDWWNAAESVVIDYKTTDASAHPAQWSRSTMAGIGADIQGAMYQRAMRAAGIETGRQVFLVQETSPPYACSAVGVTNTGQALADDRLEFALSLWGRCLRSDEWPGYPQRIAWAEPPAWAIAQWEEAKMTGLDFYDRLFGRSAE